MAKHFVALDDPVHNLLRQLTRHTPLGGDDGVPIRYRCSPESLPDAYIALAWFHALGGLPTNGTDLQSWRVPIPKREWICDRVGWFDAVRLDRRCCRDLRLRLDRAAPRLLSTDLLAFGLGTLRARNDSPVEPVHQFLRRRYGTLSSQKQTSFATLRTLLPDAACEPTVLHKEAFDSTNLIYGDALGEVQQLWDRRADTAFLERVAHGLTGARQAGELAAFIHPPLHLRELWRLHLRAQALWKIPPVSARALLRRIDYILEHTVLDSSPIVVYEAAPPAVKPARQPRRNSTGWRSDSSGYDGWLN